MSVDTTPDPSVITGLNITSQQALLYGGILLGLYLGIQILEDYL